jgi:hypothetical protein
MASEIYEMWLNEIRQYDRDVIGDLVGAFSHVSKDGRVLFYGWGTFIRSYKENIGRNVANGFYNKYQYIVRECKLTNGCVVDNKSAFLIDEKQTTKILDLGYTEQRVVPYINVYQNMRDEYSGFQ